MGLITEDLTSLPSESRKWRRKGGGAEEALSEIPAGNILYSVQDTELSAHSGSRARPEQDGHKEVHTKANHNQTSANDIGVLIRNHRDQKEVAQYFSSMERKELSK